MATSLNERDMDDATAKLGRHPGEQIPEGEEKDPPLADPGDITGTVQPKSGVKPEWGEGA